MNKLVNNKKIYAMVVSYNNVRVLEEMYNRIDKTIFYKIFFFDNNSLDESVEIAKKFDWIIIKNEKNLGHGENLKTIILFLLAKFNFYKFKIFS